MRRWTLMLALIAAVPVRSNAEEFGNRADATSLQRECGLSQREFNNFVEYLADESEGSFDNKLADLPNDLAQCIEDVLNAEVDAQNLRIAAEIRNERASSPAALAIVEEYDVDPSEIAQVAWVQPIDNGVSLEEIEIVTLEDGTAYYYFPRDGSTSDSEPPALTWTNEHRERGTGITNVRGWCTSAEWVVRFPILPTCFKEISPGRFEGIDDAWASGPNCHFGCYPICAGGQCGPAWDGYGYNDWWGFAGCSGRDSSWTTDAGKMVQKRWYYSWHDCRNNKSDSQIAYMVERLIHW